jgi:hypothetical protein
MEGVMKRFGIAAAVVCIGMVSFTLFDRVAAQEAVELKVSHPEGKTVYHKYSYVFDFQSDHPELVDPTTSGRGIARVVDYGEWVSGVATESDKPTEAEKVPEGLTKVRATIEKSESQPSVGGARLGSERFPHTLENLTGREFTWRLTGRDSVSDFRGEFQAYAISRADIVTDLYQLWMPEAYPVLPEGPVTKGSSWTGSRSFEMPYRQMNGSALVSFTTEVELKEIKEKKGRRLAILQEKRKVKYRKWLFVSPVSIVFEGEGEAKGEWAIDLDRQLVQSHKMKLRLKRPVVRTAGKEKVHEQVTAQVQLEIKSKFVRVEPE